MHQGAGVADEVKSRLARYVTSEVAYVIFLAIVVAVFAYGPFHAPAIFSDDWTQGIERQIIGGAKWLNPANRRPLMMVPFLIQYRLVGLNVTAYYIVLWSVHILLSVLLYLSLNRFPLMRRNFLGLIITLLFLVFPTSYAHMWLTMLHGYSAFILTLLYGYLILRFAGGGRWFALALSLIALLISLGVYEAQAGLASCWALILFFVYRQNTICRRLALLTPILLVGVFTLWRTLGYQAANINDDYLASITLAPGALLSRLILGYKISLIWGWTTTIQRFLPTLPGNKSAFVLLAGTTVALWWLSRQIINRHDKNNRDAEVMAWSLNQRWSTIRLYAFSSLAGLVSIGAGYIPVIAVFMPNLSSTASRINLFASVGSAVFLASILMIGSLLFAKNREQVKYLFLAAALLFLILGIVTHASVQYDTRVAWREQQTIWQELFSVAPDFKDNTMVVFVLSGFKDRIGYQNWQRTPLDASWEVSSGVQLLYNNQTLSADVVFADIEMPMAPALTLEGIFTQDTGTLAPYSRVVAFIFDREANVLRQLDGLPTELVEGAVGLTKLCTDCILNERGLEVPIRRLVRP